MQTQFLTKQSPTSIGHEHEQNIDFALRIPAEARGGNPWGEDRLFPTIPGYSRLCPTIPDPIVTDYARLFPTRLFPTIPVYV